MEKFIVGDVCGSPNHSCSLSLVLNEKSGIMDDVIFSIHKNHIGCVLNAGNKEKDLKHLEFLQQEFFKNKDISV